MDRLLWYLKQLFPLTYHTTYADEKGKHVTIWKMWLGKSYDINDYIIDMDAHLEQAESALRGEIDSSELDFAHEYVKKLNRR